MTEPSNETAFNAVNDDAELKEGLLSLNQNFGDLCIRVCGEVWGKPRISQKTKCLLTIALDVANQSIGSGTPSISNMIRPGASRAAQYSGEPYLYPYELLSVLKRSEDLGKYESTHDRHVSYDA